MAEMEVLEDLQSNITVLLNATKKKIVPKYRRTCGQGHVATVITLYLTQT